MSLLSLRPPPHHPLHLLPCSLCCLNASLLPCAGHGEVEKAAACSQGGAKAAGSGGGSSGGAEGDQEAGRSAGKAGATAWQASRPPGLWAGGRRDVLRRSTTPVLSVRACVCVISLGLFGFVFVFNGCVVHGPAAAAAAVPGSMCLCLHAVSVCVPAHCVSAAALPAWDASQQQQAVLLQQQQLAGCQAAQCSAGGRAGCLLGRSGIGTSAGPHAGCRVHDKVLPAGFNGHMPQQLVTPPPSSCSDT